MSTFLTSDDDKMTTEPTHHDPDPIETREWVDSLDSVLAHRGRERTRYILETLIDRANVVNALPDEILITDYVNTIPVEEEPAFPGDVDMERRIRRIIRWNAMAMVVRANTQFDGIGGHISTYASAASLYEVGFNHFFRGKDGEGSGDQIYFQGHAAPGIYARAHLEGRMNDEQLDRFRRETERGAGLSSYPHPRLMPDFWEFPTVSMGLGPMAAIYQARFNRYLFQRGIADTSQSRVWAFCGDGEMDEPESLGALWLAGRERLDNLTMVINCNLQRLDGPVRGNSKIIQELEGIFRGAGWNVIKVIWGNGWDPLLAADDHGLLRARMNEIVDGQFQKYATMPGSFTREDFFGKSPELAKLVEHLSDADIEKLRRGGHDYEKVYAAYKTATEFKGRPTVILAHTVKGWTLGAEFEARNVTHQKKKMKENELKTFRDKLELPISDDQLADLPPFYHPGMDSDEVKYVLERRHSLGGFVPKRRTKITDKLDVPKSDVYDEFYKGMAKGGASTTMAYVRLLIKLIRDDGFGARIVPIIPDEARTFGMDSFFREVGIYAAHGQQYEPVDKGMLLYYREATNGQVLEEGITEAGSISSFTAAGTAHTSHDKIMVPFYTFYSMFGFQRIGDQAWAFGDSGGRGFLMGATAGRTTLNGEGLQHQDGHSHLLASVVPNIRSYDPAFAYEVAAVIEAGLREMVDEQKDVFYYITLYNEVHPMPALPSGVTKDDILGGLYRFEKTKRKKRAHVQLIGSGPILQQVLRAKEILEKDFAVSADVWSAPSYQRLRNDAIACERWNRLHPTDEPRIPRVERILDGVEGPFIAATDYMQAIPDQIHRWVPGTFVALGTDGYGMSDTREALRRHFEVDAESIAIAALSALLDEEKVSEKKVADAITKLGLDPDKVDPVDI